MTKNNWIITGVNSGFGRELTTRLLSRGDRVVGTVRRPESVADLREAFPDSFHIETLDLTDTARIRPIVDAAAEWLGGVHGVISNAGYGLFGAAEEYTDEQVQHQIATNLLGSIQLVRSSLPHLRANGGGRVVILSSVAGGAAYPAASLYHATKWGIEGFGESLAGEVAPFGIGVTIVEPGGARTEFAGGSLRWAPANDAYAAGPVGAVRSMFAEGIGAPGDPAKMADAMLAAVARDPAPLRLILGTDSWAGITRALTARLADAQEQHDTATATDAD
jgi:NAD(P)-dependent dehydrogenase (short-subunit alcohol dehydrogenase family)